LGDVVLQLRGRRLLRGTSPTGATAYSLTSLAPEAGRIVRLKIPRDRKFSSRGNVGGMMHIEVHSAGDDMHALLDERPMDFTLKERPHVRWQKQVFTVVRKDRSGKPRGGARGVVRMGGRSAKPLAGRGSQRRRIGREDRSCGRTRGQEAVLAPSSCTRMISRHVGSMKGLATRASDRSISATACCDSTWVAVFRRFNAPSKVHRTHGCVSRRSDALSSKIRAFVFLSYRAAEEGRGQYKVAALLAEVVILWWAVPCARGSTSPEKIRAW
jgi:hypothetical protein